MTVVLLTKSTDNAQQFVYNGNNLFVQYYRNPSRSLYRDYCRFQLISDFQGTAAAKAYRPRLDIESRNRSSVVTLFDRVDVGLNALFTGDAWDASCDIRRTIQAFGVSGTQPTSFMDVNILKVGINTCKT